MQPSPANIFVMGLDDFHLAQLRTLPRARGYAFHPLFTHDELRRGPDFPVRELIDRGVNRLRDFPGRVDAVVGYLDFPVSTLLPVFRRAVGLPGPSLESVLKCEHKYWSRLEQARVVPAHVPAFCAVNPFSADPLAHIDLPFPFWIKPVKSVLSHLGFLVQGRTDFEHAIARIRAGIGRIGVPFDLILALAVLPPEAAAVDGCHCIAEAVISRGRQCTLEGYARGGRVVVYGTVDSLREGAAGSCFARYQYPSTLPAAVQARMAAIAARVMPHLGYDDAPFNMELYWDEATDRIWLLEINTRISQSHGPLFHMVDGCYHHQVMIDLALGREPEMPRRAGPHRCAAKFMLRSHADARVARVPTAREIAALEAAVPGTRIQVHVRAGMRLSELGYQDSYSYETAAVFIGADDVDELERRYARVRDALPLTLEPVPDRPRVEEMG